MFNKAILAVATLAAAQTAMATPTPQLAGLSLVCLTDNSALSAVTSLLSILPGLDLISCASGETCESLDLPLLGSILPIGTCSSASSSSGGSSGGLLGGIL